MNLADLALQNVCLCQAFYWVLENQSIASLTVRKKKND
jgi:hypothetical protein